MKIRWPWFLYHVRGPLCLVFLMLVYIPVFLSILYSGYLEGLIRQKGKAYKSRYTQKEILEVTHE